jgi:hypothetical protein
MARTVTLSQLRSDALLYADERPNSASTFITTTEATRLVNLALTELYDLLVAARGHEHYETVTEAVSTVAGVATVNQPTGFYQLLSLHLKWSATDIEPVSDLEHVADRHRLVNRGTWTAWGPKAFRIRGTVIEFFPTPTTATVLQIRYVPAFTDLAADGDTFDGVNGWEKLVALRAAIEMRAINRQPGGELERLYERERDRIEALAADRASSSPKRIRDAAPEARRGWGWPYHGRASS